MLTLQTLGTRKPDTKPQPDMKQHVLLSPRHGRECSKLQVFCHFPSYECKPDMKHNEKNTICSSFNMKPKTQCEMKASQSFNIVGSTTSPDTKKARYETSSSLRGFPGACWGQRRKQTLQNYPFNVSPQDAVSAPLARSDVR